VNGKALQLTNTNAGTSATALGLNVASGHQPFTVNSTTKVANLNADLLDGIDSTALQKRVSGTCASGTAIRAIASSGSSVTCQDTRTNVLLQGTSSSLADTATFTSHGGTLLVFFSGSGYRTTAQGPGELSLTGQIDGIGEVSTGVYTNETQSHKTLIPVVVAVSPQAVGAGTHTFSVSADTAGGTSFDSLDDWSVTIIELPH
jgi:hypothetical protein